MEQTIGQGIIAQCQLNNLNPHVESDRQKAANSIADMADSLVGKISKFQWEVAVAHIGQLASEMRLSTGSLSVGGSNGRSAQKDACSGKNAMSWQIGMEQKRDVWEYSFLYLLFLACLFAITDSLIY